VKQVLVNEIIEQNGITHGLVVWESTVNKSMELMFKGDGFILKNIEHFKKNLPDPSGFHFITRYCQFVVYYEYHPFTGSAMKVSDFAYNIDDALDEYIRLAEKEWKIEDRESLMKSFQKIQEDKSGVLAEMIIDESVPKIQ
jgi:hypothetical protein